MKIKDIQNIRSLESGAVDCEILFFGMNEYIPYTATPEDSTESGEQIWLELQSGKWGVIPPFKATQEMIVAAKESKKQEIEVWRKFQETKPFTFEWKGHKWNGGAESIARLMPVVVAAKSSATRDSLEWGDAENRMINLSMSELEELATTMAQLLMHRNNHIYKRQRELKDALNELENLESIRVFNVA